MGLIFIFSALFQCSSEDKNVAVFNTLKAAICARRHNPEKYIFGKEIGRFGKRIFLVTTKVYQRIINL